MEKKKYLSIIIPFLNEGQEVENTIQSIRSFSDNNVEIILINDASDDNYDYETISQIYDTIYILNQVRIGVAASRDKGINIASSPYFLLLDAHMRFYNNKWVETIIHYLENNENVLLCCQTKILSKEDDKIIEKDSLIPTYGAFIEFDRCENLLGSVWTVKEFPENKDLETTPIPCVLGAGYACTTKYWKYLRGLEGLKYYGSDEIYISLKVWLNGGECLLLKNVFIGHIYRTEFPYSVKSLDTIYNRLLIAILLLPIEYKKKIFSLTKKRYLYIYNEILWLLLEKYEQIIDLKNYYNTILKHEFNSFILLNAKVQKKDMISYNKEQLKSIAYSLLIKCYSLNDIGLMNGRMGIIIFLFHYAQYSNEKLLEELAQYLLEKLANKLHISQSLNFYSGLTGIGWGIEYLSQQKFISEDTNELLEEFDERIMEVNVLKMKDLSFGFGLGGIVHYLLSRLYTINKKKSINPFDEKFLKNVYQVIKSIIKNKITCDSLDVFIRYYFFYEKNIIEKPSLYDICPLTAPNDYNENYSKIGLDGGSAGIGLKIILDKNYEELNE